MNIINDFFNKNEKIYFPFQRIKFRRTKSVKDIIKKDFNMIKKYNDVLSNFSNFQKLEKKKNVFCDKSDIEE